MSQRDVSVTTFGFAGLVINRPHIFGINARNQRERKAFLHFWAVINHMIGVEDRFNICLLPIESAQIVFDLLMRNLLSPYLQIETLTFKHMINVMLVGFQQYVPFLEYDSQLFLLKRAVGLPGYQLDVDSKLEIPYRNILSPQDVAEIRVVEPKFTEKILIYKVKRSSKSSSDCRSSKKINPYSPNEVMDFYNEDTATQKKLLGLPCYAQIRKIELERGPSYLKYLNAKKFDSLHPQAQYLVQLNNAVISLMAQKGGINLLNVLVDTRTNEMRNMTDAFNFRFDLNPVYPTFYVKGPGIK